MNGLVEWKDYRKPARNVNLRTGINQNGRVLKMSEAMWVAIIGIAGTILASGIGALFTYLSMKSQNSSRLTELQQQYVNERKSMQIEKLLESRASYLRPLSEEVAACCKALSGMRDAIIKTYYNGEGKGVSKQLMEEYKKGRLVVDNEFENLSAAIKRCNIILSKTNDDKISQLFSNLEQPQIIIAENLLLLDGESFLLPDKKYDFDKMLDSLTEFASITREINGRIEILLCGMD